MNADGLSHIDLDNIGERFEDGTWTPQDVASLFLEIQRLKNVIAEYVPATDFDGELVGVFLDAHGKTASIWFMDADEAKPDGWHQLYRRVPSQQAAITEPACPRCEHPIGGHGDSGCSDCDCPLASKHATWLADKIAAKAASVTA